MSDARQRPTPPGGARRGLLALIAATGISSVGDGAFIAAAPLAAVVVTRNPAVVAIVTAAEYLPWLFVAPFAGYYVDRWPRRSTMIAADLMRVLFVALLGIAVATGTASIAAIATCAFLIVSGNVFHSAAAEATIADLAIEDDRLLHTTNGRQQVAYTGGRQLVGPPLGSLTFSLARWLPFVLDAASFLASAILIAAVPRTPAARSPGSGIWQTLRTSTAYLVGHRELRTLAFLTAAGNFSINMVMGVLVLYATDPGGLGINNAGYGFLLVAMAIGGMAGGFLVPRVIGWLGGRMTMVVALGAEGGAWLLLATAHHPAVAGVALTVAFVGVTLVSVVVMSARQRQAPPELLGQVISAFRIIGNGPAPVGALAGGALAGYAGLRAPILAAALVTLLAVLLVLRTRSTR